MAVPFMNALLVMVYITYMKVAANIRMSLAKALPCTCILLLIIFAFIEGLLRFRFFSTGILHGHDILHGQGGWFCFCF